VLVSQLLEGVMHASRCARSLVFIGVAAALASTAARAQCQTWQPGRSTMGVDGAVFAVCRFDNGSGPAIFAGGTFAHAGGDAASNIARWNGSVWSALNGGANGTVRSMVVFDDGSGPALYVAGDFTAVDGTSANHIARWTGTLWSALSVGTDGPVDALSVFDDGGGPALYAGGSFHNAGGSGAANVAKWNGSTWSSVGGGVDSSVFALTVFDDGAGAQLYAGGGFANAGGSGAAHVAKWNGSAWSSLGAGTDDVVFALTVFGDGAGASLYAGGVFANAGGSAAAHVARWSGSAWSALRGGLSNSVYALGTFDDGAGLALYASGDFHVTPAGNYISKWNGSSWTPLGMGTESTPHALLAFDDGTGSALFVAGAFSIAGGVTSKGIAKWSGSSWAGVGGGADDYVLALAVFDDGTGRALYAAGEFQSIGAIHASYVARWDGVRWSSLGDGTNNRVRALTVFDDGTGPALYAGGRFTVAGGVNANRVAKWNGSSWSALAGGIDGANDEVFALAAFDDGGGSELYAGGTVSDADGGPASSIAKWNGSTWSALGSGASGGFEPYVVDLATFDDGTGLALYASGGFTSFSGIGANGIARWDGTNWTALGSGITGVGIVHALSVYDDGAGPALYAGGSFNSAGGNPAASIARWNGTNWSPLATGVNGFVEALAPYDDGSGAGARLYATGSFVNAGGNGANRIASWDGATWAPLGAGLGGTGETLAAFDAGSGGGTDLFVGGEFQYAGGVSSGRFAQWNGCGRPGVPMCFGDGSGGVCPCSNFGWTGRGCNNSAATGGAVLVSAGWASLAFDSLKLTSTNELANAFSEFLQGTIEIAPTPFGDGLRCAGGNVKRLFTRQASSGSVSAPQSDEVSISARAAALGDVIGVASTRTYQVYYRDPSLTFCPSSAGNTWNVSSGLRIEWLP
jgi:hypothetical protein